MRIGYSFWGFLGDYKMDADGNEVSSPDGCAAYAWSIVHEAVKRDHEVIPLQFLRDKHALNFVNFDRLFGSFSTEKRQDAITHLNIMHDQYESFWRMPELDVVLLEWRWPIPGKNCQLNPNGTWWTPADMSQDLLRQTQILHHYTELGVPVIIWDLDHKLTITDERRWSPAAIFETSASPRAQHIVRTRVEFPFLVDDLLQYATLSPDPKRKLVYIGNNYERDDVIDQYVAPFAKNHPGEVEFWGKWDKSDQLWPKITYRDRIAMRDFLNVYGTAVACPLLAKRSYLETGFVTPRPVEALLFGTLPIGLNEHLGVHKYVTLTSGYKDTFENAIGYLTGLTLKGRHEEREELAHQLEFVDAKYFLEKIEDVVQQSA